MTTKIYERSLWYDTRLLSRLKAIVGDVETKISRVASGETFSPQHNINMNGNQLLNIEVDETNDGSAVNVSYVKSKFDRLEDYRKVAVFENSGEVSVDGEVIVEVPLKGIIYDDQMIAVDGATLALMSAGLYKIEVVTDLEGMFDDGYLELVVVKMNVDGVAEESVVKKHYLNETLINSLTKTFDGGEMLKIRVTNTNADKTFSIQTTLSFDKLY